MRRTREIEPIMVRPRDTCPVPPRKFTINFHHGEIEVEYSSDSGNLLILSSHDSALNEDDEIAVRNGVAIFPGIAQGEHYVPPPEGMHWACIDNRRYFDIDDPVVTDESRCLYTLGTKCYTFNIHWPSGANRLPQLPFKAEGRCIVRQSPGDALGERFFVVDATNNLWLAYYDGDLNEGDFWLCDQPEEFSYITASVLDTLGISEKKFAWEGEALKLGWTPPRKGE